MSVSVSKPEYAAPPRPGRLPAQPLTVDFEPSDLLVRLSNVGLPLIAVLESCCCPAALWSEDRSQSIFNAAAAAQLGLPENGISGGQDVWLDCVDPRDRARFRSALQTLQSGAAKVVCSYRFIPRVAMGTIELQETALRLAVDAAGRWAVLSRYQVREPKRRGHARRRALVHQIANNLQSIRGEVDLLRLCGALPQTSFDGIVQAIESIRELTVELDDIGAARAPAPARDMLLPATPGRKCAEEVRRGRT